MTGSTLSTPSPGISTLAIRQCLRLASAKGLDVSRLLSDAGLRREQLQSPSDWVDFRLVEPVLEQALLRLKDPLTGLHAAAHVNMSTLGVLGYATQTSSTLEDLINTIIHFGTLISDIGQARLQHEPGAALWQWQFTIGRPLLARHAAECVLASWAGLLRLMKQRSVPVLLGVHFQHELPAAELLPEYQRIFGCPVRFAQPDTALLLTPQALSAPLLQADPDLHHMLEQHAQQQLQSRQQDSNVIEQVRQALQRELAQGLAPSREKIAQQLGMSGRHLHRKLEDAGTGFRDLQDEIRYTMARAELVGKNVSVERVAQALGFQESQSFIRWFRRMAGCTPGEYRLRAVPTH